MMKLLAVSHNLNLEGAAISMFEMISAVSTQSDLEPIVMSFQNGPLAARYQEKNISMMSLPFSEGMLRREKEIETAIGELANLIEKLEIEMVYGNTFLAYPAIIAAHRSGRPSVWNIRESQSIDYWQTYLGSRLELAMDALSKASKIVFVSQATKTLWKERVAEIADDCIPNALNTAEFLNRKTGLSRESWREMHQIPTDACVFLCVGTFHERKGQMDILQALSRVQVDGVPAVGVLIGDAGGEYSEAMNAYCMGRQVDCRLLPKTDMILDGYQAADVFICSSRNESYPRIILEAMECGLPIITTNVFGIAEQVEFGENALEYAPGDVDALANAIGLLCANVEKRKAMAEKSLALTRRHITFADMTKRYADIFENITGHISVP
ncbi:MAG: glycosyltransferase family 4 protein [Gammaproteobacteria bacterium]|nr:glycosyltransferase family 4 protein [Gammaproteobacteria bacterium]